MAALVGARCAQSFECRTWPPRPCAVRKTFRHTGQNGGVVPGWPTGAPVGIPLLWFVRQLLP